MAFTNKKTKAAFYSIVSNSFLILLKLISGFLTGSISILSEAVHSFTDLLASVIAFFSVKASSEPADDGHPFGHGKYEDLSGLFEGALIVLAGIYIITESIHKLIDGVVLSEHLNVGIVVMFISVVVNVFVSRYLFKVAKETDSMAILADAEHLRADILTSLGVFAGLIAIKVTGIHIIDPIFAILIALFIFKVGMSLCIQSMKNLLDGSLPEEEQNSIQQIVKSYIPKDIQSIKNLQTRKAGATRFINMTLIVHDYMTVKEGHFLCDKIENEIEQNFNHTSIVIHLEPFENSEDLKHLEI